MPIKYLNGVAQFWGGVGDKIANEFEYSVLKGNAPEQLENTRHSIFGTDPNAVAAGKLVQNIADRTPIGVAEQGAAILGGNIAETVGAPRVVGEMLGGLAVPGSQIPSVQTATKTVVNNGSVRLLQSLPAEPVQALTATKNLAPGVAEGVATDPRFATGVSKLRAQGAADAARTEKFLAEFATGQIDKATLTERLSKVKKRGDAKYSTLATPDDPDIFEVRSQQNVDPTNPLVMADQHHAATKAMTTPWVKKALELGDDDDVVALFELHRQLTGSGMGNARSGIIDAPGVIHDTAKAKKAGRDPSKAIHSFFKKGGAGIEIRTKDVEAIIGNPKNMDELLDKYVTFAQEYLIPQRELSLKAVKKELNRHAETLSGAEKEQFIKLVNKLNMAGT